MFRLRGDTTITKSVVMSGWEDAAHISKEDAASLAASYLPYEREARTRGIPSIGSGAIYPVPESDLLCDPFELPEWYEYAYALDVGWRRTAALWGARDPETDILYLWSEYYRGEAEPPIHAEAIRSRGEWIPGVIDPAARGRSQHDGQRLRQVYTDLGLTLSDADNAVTAGIYETWTRMSTGRLKIFSTLQNLRNELRIYRRNEKGEIVKENDHLCDCLRYLCMSGVKVAAQTPIRALAGRRAKHEFESNPLERMYQVQR